MNQNFDNNLTLKKQSTLSPLSIYNEISSNTPDILTEYENMLKEVNGLLPQLEGFFDKSKNEKKKVGRSKANSKKTKAPYNILKNTPKSSFIRIITASKCVIEEILLTREEVKILRTASKDNYGIINLLSLKESIMSLFNKGVIAITDKENARLGIKEELLQVFDSNTNDGVYMIEDGVVEWGRLWF